MLKFLDHMGNYICNYKEPSHTVTYFVSLLFPFSFLRIFYLPHARNIRNMKEGNEQPNHAILNSVNITTYRRIRGSQISKQDSSLAAV